MSLIYCDFSASGRARKVRREGACRTPWSESEYTVHVTTYHLPNSQISFLRTHSPTKIRLCEQGLPGKDGETGPSGPSGPAVSTDVHLHDKVVFLAVSMS